MEDLFRAVRSACSTGAWSRGVELARAGAVLTESDAHDIVELRVATRRGIISPRVALYPADEEWECECAGAEDPCEHVAAAVIAWRQARQGGRMLGAATPPGHVRYVLSSNADGALELEREIVRGDRIHRVKRTLAGIAAGREAGPDFAASRSDIEVERALGSRLRGELARESVGRVVDALSRCPDVVLDGEAVTASEERLVPRGRVTDDPNGFRLSIGPDPSVTRTFRNGLALCGSVLRAVGESRLTGRELEDLPRGQVFTPDQAANLVSAVLPDLEARIPLEIETTRLPRATAAETPRIRVAVARDGDALAALPTLVYGDPVRARIDSGRLVHVSGPVPIRDEPAERARVRDLRARLGLEVGRRVVLRGEDALALAERLARFPGDVEGDAHRSFFRADPLTPRIELSDGRRIDVSFVSDPDPNGSTAGPGTARRTSADAVLRAWREGESWVPLTGGGFAPLPAEWLERFGHRVADLLAAREANGALPAAAGPALVGLCDDLDLPRPADLSRLAPLVDGFDGIPPAALPGDLRGELRSYQRRGVDWLCFLREAGLGALLADDMGLGKTLQTLCALRGRCLVVAPTSLLHVWEGEIRRFRPEMRAALYHGAGRRLDPDADVTLTSYAILRLDASELAAVAWDSVVLDEAQQIKNPDSQVAAAAYGLTAHFRIAVTGTPVENRLDELWSQLHFTNRGLFAGRQDFARRYAQPIADGKVEASERLRERIRPFVLRRLKRDVAAELPPRTDVVLDFELDTGERQVYDSVRAATVPEVVLRLRAGGGVMAALEALLRLRQAACHPSLVPGQDAERSSKVDLLRDRLEQAMEDGHRALVFSQWTALLDRIEPHLRAAGLPFERLDGTTRDRAAVVDRFQKEEGPPVMLVSLRAGGTGLNLTAADHVFLMDPWWNPAVEDQAADRAHRIGQVRPVIVHRLVAQDTVEERILELHRSKRALSEAVLGDAGDGAGLTREDLLALLS